MTPMVGYNNAGKTTVLKAISWLFKRSSLSAENFNDPSSPIVVTGIVGGITPEVLALLNDDHRQRIAAFVVGGEIPIRRSQPTPSCPIKDVRLEIGTIDAGGEIDWGANPTGIEGAISDLFPECIFVGAMENVLDDLAKNTSTTTIGKLLKEIIAPVQERHSDSVRAAMLDLEKLFSAKGEAKDADLVKTDRIINQEVGKFFPEISVKTHLPVPAFGDFLKGATLKVFEGDGDDTPERGADAMGHGALRAVQMALIKSLAEIKKDAAGKDGRTTMLLIDEPELYLHPQAVLMVRNALKTLSEHGYQIVFTTHSASMVQRTDAPHALLIRKGAAAGTISLPRMRDAIEANMLDAPVQAEALFTLGNASKILFSDRVLLGEGKTETTLLPEIYRHVTGAELSDRNTSLISMDTAGATGKYLNVLRAMGLDARAVVDLDFAFRNAIGAGLLDEADRDLATCKTLLYEMQAAGQLALGADGFPMRSGGRSAAQGFAAFAAQPAAAGPINALHQKLKEHGIWLWERGAIESHVGLTAKSNAARAQLVSNLETAGYLAELPGFDAVKRFCDWVAEDSWSVAG